MKILITGGLGFIGSHLAKRLIRIGEDVHIYDNRTNNKVSKVIGAKEVIDFKSQSWDVVYHLAAVARIQPGYDFDTITSNIILAREVLSLPCRVVYASSASTKQPKTLYALTKMDNDEFANTNPNAYGLQFENVYGENDNGVIGKILKCCLWGETFTLNGGYQTRDFIHVDDVVSELIIAGSVSGRDKITPIGTGVATSINQVIEICERVTGKVLDLECNELPRHEIVDSVCEKPLNNFISLEDGIYKYYLSLTL